MKNNYTYKAKIRKTALFTLLAIMGFCLQNVMAQNVGISDLSTFTPTSLFHVHSTSAGQLFQLSNLNTSVGNTPTANSGFNIGIDASMNLTFNQYENASMSFLTNHVSRMIIDKNGYTGINVTPSSTYQLDVYSNSNTAIRGYYSANIYGYVGSTTSGVFGTSNSSSGAGVFGNGVGTDGVYGQVNETGGSGYSAINGYNSNATGVGIYGFGAATVASYSAGAGVVGNGTVGVFGSNTSGIFGYLGSNIDGVVGISTSGSGTGVWGQNSNANGDGLYGINNAASGSGTGSGIQGITSQGGNGATQTAGVWGVLTNTAPSSGCGIGGYVGSSGSVSGYNKTAVSGVSLSVAGGCGVIASTDNATGYAMYGANAAAAGTGIIGFGNNITVCMNPNTAGSGGNFSGTRYGSISYASNNSTAGTGYTNTTTYTGAWSNIPTSVAANTSMYHFGVQGSCSDIGVGYGLRSGGVLGYHNYGPKWGCLGYNNSANNPYGVYAGGSYALGAAGGKLINDSNKVAIGFGIGAYGDLVGGWIRGDIYGLVAKGNRYSLYVDGKTYTNNIIAQLSESNNTYLAKGSKKKIVSYVPTSTTVDVYTKGTSTLINGTANVRFDDNFNKLISINIPIVITVTPMGECNGVYVTEVTNDGFIVKELQSGNSNVKFSYIAIGTKYGCENPENPEEILEPTYDANMNGVMFNEDDIINSATPIYWDNKEKKLKFQEHNFKSEIEYLAPIEIKMDMIKAKNIESDKVNNTIELKSQKISKINNE